MDHKPLPATANTIPLLLVAILGLSLSAASQYDHTYYVTPNVSSCTNIYHTCQELKTYFNNASYYFQSGTEFIFLPGVHLFDLESILLVQGIVNIRLVGSDNFTQRSVAENVEEYGLHPYAYDYNITYFQSSTIILCTNPSALSFSNVKNLTLANFTILNCGQYLNNASNLLIDGLSVQNSSGFGLYALNVLGTSQITRSSFVGNNQFVKKIFQDVPIRNCKNETGSLYITGSLTEYKGGNVEFIYSNVSLTSSNIQLNILLVVVALGINRDDSYGAGLAISSDESLHNLNINIDDLITYRNQAGTGANFCFAVSSPISNITLTNIFSAYATSVGTGAWYNTDISTIASWFTVTNVTFECNLSQEGDGSSLYIAYQSGYGFVTLDNCIFTLDQSLCSLYIYNSNNIYISDSSFHSCNVRADNSLYEMNDCKTLLGISFNPQYNFMDTTSLYILKYYCNIHMFLYRKITPLFNLS